MEVFIAIVAYALFMVLLYFVITRWMTHASNKRMQVEMDKWDADVAKIFNN